MENKNKPKKKKLTRKQKMQIRIRRLKTLSLEKALITSFVMFVLFLVVSNAMSVFYEFGNKEVQPRTEDDLVVMDFVGDVMLGRGIAELAESKGYPYLYRGVADYWKQSDLVAANVESAVLRLPENQYKREDKKIRLFLSCNYDALDSLREAGVNLFGFANNHITDFGIEPIEELISYMKNEEVLYSGIGMNRSDAVKYVLTNVNGVKVAFISVSDIYYAPDIAGEQSAGVLTTGYTGYNQIVNRASRESDLTIVYMHFGEENEVTTNKHQEQIAHQLVEAGANIVIGSHPHVVQKAEKYRDGMIFYSMGNFIFDQGNTFSRDSMMLQLKVNKTGKCEFEVIPMRINNGVPMVADEIYTKRINHEITSGLAESDYYLNEKEHVMIPAFSLIFKRVDVPWKGEPYSKWQNIALRV